MTLYDYLSIFAIILSCIALFVSIRYRLIQIRLSRIEMRDKLNEHLSEHYENLRKFFFSKVLDIFGVDIINDSNVFEGVGNYLKKIKELSESRVSKDYWTAGMNHLKLDDYTSWQSLKSINDDEMDYLERKTKKLNDILKNNVQSLFRSEQIVNKYGDMSAGKIYLPGLLGAIKSELSEFLYTCTKDGKDCFNCLKDITIPPVDADSRGILSKRSTTIAMTSQSLSKGEIESKISKIEKNDDLLNKMIEVWKLRVQFREDSETIARNCTEIIKKIDNKTYSTKAACCPKR